MTHMKIVRTTYVSTIYREFGSCFGFLDITIQFKIVLSLNNTVCDNYTNYTNKHVTKRT
jgi:hypothetical protein